MALGKVIFFLFFFTVFRFFTENYPVKPQVLDVRSSPAKADTTLDFYFKKIPPSEITFDRSLENLCFSKTTLPIISLIVQSNKQIVGFFAA